MKLLIVENDDKTILAFLASIKELGWSYYMHSFGKDEIADESMIRQFLNDVCEQRPDIVLLDAALTTKEERLLDELHLAGKEVPENSLSGFKYCRALASERLGIPIIFLSKGHAEVARTAMRVGADRVLVKKSDNAGLIREIEELVKAKTPHDAAFYWPMRSKLEKDLNVWQGESLRLALDRFYMNGSSVKRFGLLTASLRSLISPMFKGDKEAEKKLMLSLLKSQVLLSLVDPRLRDHVKHTGNVFWLGYRLLNELPEFNDPLSLPGAVAALYDASGPLTPKDQLFHAWALAALFHDFGYVDERQSQLTGLITSLLPSLKIEHSEVRDEPTWNKNIDLLRTLVKGLLGDRHFLYKFIDSVMTSFASKIIHKGTRRVDHGFLSAHRLLDMIPLDSLDAQNKNIVLHAAMAIAYHNYVDILRNWGLNTECKGALPIGVLPVCSLLAFCDNIQTWDREPEIAPALGHSEAYDGLLERLVLLETAYVSGSDICEFSTSRRPDDSTYDVKVKLRYFVENGNNVKKACENLGDGIQGWIDKGSLKEVCAMTGVSSLIHGEIIYELPMRAGTRRASF